MSQIFDLTSVQHVFHGSPQNGLDLIHPKISTHGECWVYATPFLEIACTYLAKWDDLDFAQTMYYDDFHLVERYPYAFEQIFPDAKGSIYLLPTSTFKSFNYMEAVSLEPVAPLKEIVIDNSWNFIQELAKTRKLHLHTYPNRPSFIPKDDSDIVVKVSKWLLESPSSKRKSDLFGRFSKKHPMLVDQLKI